MISYYKLITEQYQDKAISMGSDIINCDRCCRFPISIFSRQCKYGPGGEGHQSCRTQIGADDFQTRQDAISVLFSQRCGVVIVTRLPQAAAQQQVAIDRFRLLGVGCGILSHLNRGAPLCRLWFECCSAVSPWEILDEAIRDREGKAVGVEALEEHESTQVESQSGK